SAFVVFPLSVALSCPLRFQHLLAPHSLFGFPPPPTPTLFPYTTLFRSAPQHHPPQQQAAPMPQAGPQHRAPTGGAAALPAASARSEEHTSELQSRFDLVCRLLLEKKKTDAQPPGGARRRVRAPRWGGPR